MPKQIREMTQKQRWAAIRKGLKNNKSQRAIAKQLNCDEGTVRREILKMGLPQNFAEAMEQGYPAEPLLRRVRTSKAVRNSISRLEEEQASGKHSTATAQIVLQWLLDKELGDANTNYVLETIQREFWPVGDRTREKARLKPARLLASLESEVEPAYMTDRIEYCLAMLRMALPKIAPEKLIRDGAFTKMIAAAKQAKSRPRILSHHVGLTTWHVLAPRPSYARDGNVPKASRPF